MDHSQSVVPIIRIQILWKSAQLSKYVDCSQELLPDSLVEARPD